MQGLLLVLWSSIIFYLAGVYAQENPFWKLQSHRAEMIRVSPQGWAFFTRDPREPVDRVYIREENGWVFDERFYAGSRSSSDAFKRNRLVHVELGHALARVRSSQWVKCKDDLYTCLHEVDIERVQVTNRTNMQSVCGEFLIERQPPFPWAWASTSEVYMPSKLLHAVVQCDPK